MKNGKGSLRVIFRPRRFWASVIMIALMAAGTGISCVFGVFALFAAALVAAFIGLNEFGRWPYKTNLVICAAAAVAAAAAGVFSWTEVLSVFALFFVISAYLLYFRDRYDRLIPVLDSFAAILAQTEGFTPMIESAWRSLQEMAPEAAVFIILADINGELYLPKHFDLPERALRKSGGVPWKVYGSGKSMRISKIVTGRDQPLDRDARSLISVPLTARAEKLGVLQLEAGTAGAFSEGDTAKLSLAAVILAHELFLRGISLPYEDDDDKETDIDDNN
ncbi:MAG: hypothetical protein IKT09_03690 [Synergistes sp.]|nr:hypothetical protein [Synergistes sp.]